VVCVLFVFSVLVVSWGLVCVVSVCVYCLWLWCVVVVVLCVGVVCCGVFVECVFMLVCVCKVSVSLPEWSKGLRSGRNVFERVGSNPTADIFLPNRDNQTTTHALAVVTAKEKEKAKANAASLPFARHSSCSRVRAHPHPWHALVPDRPTQLTSHILIYSYTRGRGGGCGLRVAGCEQKSVVNC
jgi:hypothetical protein